MLIIAYWGTIAGFAIFLKNLLAVDVPQYRTIRIGDHQALSLYRNLVGLLALRWTAAAVVKRHFWKFGFYCAVLGLVVLFVVS